MRVDYSMFEGIRVGECLKGYCLAVAPLSRTENSWAKQGAANLSGGKLTAESDFRRSSFLADIFFPYIGMISNVVSH